MSKILALAKRNQWFLVVLLFWTCVYVGCNIAYPSATWRYKLTVNIETPEGIKTGSAVREITYINGPKILPDVAGSQWKVKGEAVVIDMGDGKYLFAIMDVDGSYKIVYDAFPYTPKSVHDGIAYYKSLTGQSVELKPELYPTLVTFKDIKDPKTVTLAYGYRFNTDTQKYEPVNELEQLFGQGTHIKNITLEMTDEPITKVINKYITNEFHKNFDLWWANLSIEEKSRLINLFNFTSGE